MKRASGLDPNIAAASMVILVGYVAIVALVPSVQTRTAIVDLFLCILPLFVNGALLINAITPDWRKNAFWMLLALGCSLWLAGQSAWAYIEVYQHRHIPSPFPADIVFFLHTVPMIAALTLQPHKRPNERKILYGYVDFSLMVCWWVYLYVFLVIPWQYVVVDIGNYNHAFHLVSWLENLVLVGGAAMLSLKATGYWRRVYGHLTGSAAMHTFGLVMIEISSDRRTYSRSSLFNVPLVLSLVWLGVTGTIAYRTRGEETAPEEQPATPQTPKPADPADEAVWASRTARAALLSLPVIGLWCLKADHSPAAVHEFRIMVTLGAVLPLGFLAFLRHEMVDADRLRLLRASQESLDNLKRLQTQFVQSEKLASIGQLVSGAAHEINNPLTAILGYSEMLADDAAIGDRHRNLAEKIREQARRTKTLVNNLLSFARQTPAEQRTAVNVNSVVNTAVQFLRVDLRAKNIRIDVQTSIIPEVRGDPNQLIQVFSNVINNAAYSMQEVGGGTLTVRTMVEKGNIIILFSDTGPGIREPHLVFDPFYTTKPVGKGTGLGLSICYGLVQDQGGQISCYNRPEGGATFRIELPSIPVAFPFASRTMSKGPRNIPGKLA